MELSGLCAFSSTHCKD